MADNLSASIEKKSEALVAEREESPFVRAVTLTLGGIITIIAVTWAIDFWLDLGFEWYDEQAMIACLALTFAIIFIRVPGNGSNQRLHVPWYDMVLAVLGLGGGLYFIYIYGDLADNPFINRPKAFAIGIIILPLVWEALRRTTGWSLTLVFTFFIAYGFVGHLMPGMLRGVEQNNMALIAYLGTNNVALLGLPLRIIVLTVVLFIWMGQLLLYTGASEWFTDIAAALMGRSRGGSAKIAVVASGLFGSISGSAVSNVASTGVITIPLMRQAGYDAKSAGAIEAVASTGGQIMPPIMGAAAFLMAEILQMSYTEIILSAIVPALLYYFAVFIQADLEAAKKGIAPMPEDQIPPKMKVMKEGWFFLVPFAVLVYTMFSMNMPAQKAAFWAAITVGVVSIVFGYKKQRITPRQVLNSITDCGRASADIIVIGAMAGIIIGVLEKTGLGQALTLILSIVGQHNLWLLLVLTAFISILLGMGMPTSAIYLLLATMVAPSLVKLGVYPIAAHMFVLYYGLMSMITPPVAIAAFAAASLAGSKPMETGFTAVRLGWIAYVIPFIFVMSPALLGVGSTEDVVVTTVTAFVGVWVASCGMMGFMFNHLNIVTRLLMFASGIALVLPAHVIPHGFIINIAGLVIGGGLAGKDYLDRKRGKGKTGTGSPQPVPGGGE